MQRETLAEMHRRYFETAGNANRTKARGSG